MDLLLPLLLLLLFICDEVNNFEIGDLVYSRVPQEQMGTIAEYVAVDSSAVSKKPGNISFEEAASIPLAGLTALQSLERVGIKENDKVLIHAGASGVGLAAIQLANALACQVAVTASSKVKLDKCHEMGAEILIDYNQQDFAQELKNQSFFADVIIDLAVVIILYKQYKQYKEEIILRFNIKLFQAIYIYISFFKNRTNFIKKARKRIITWCNCDTNRRVYWSFSNGSIYCKR